VRQITFSLMRPVALPREILTASEAIDAEIDRAAAALERTGASVEGSYSTP